MIHVLFLCEKNDVLSQIAEGLTNKMTEGKFKAFSAGASPSPIPALTFHRLRQLGIQQENHHSKNLESFKTGYFDYVLWIGSELDPGYSAAKKYWPNCKVWHAEVPAPNAFPPDDYLRQLDAQIQFLSSHVQLFVLSHHENLRPQFH